MQITFTPIRRSQRLDLSKVGDVLNINGDTFDFSPLQEGSSLPADAIESDWFAGSVRRVDGVLHLTLVLPHGECAPQETLFPEPLTVSVDGPITVPPYNARECER